MLITDDNLLENLTWIQKVCSKAAIDAGKKIMQIYCDENLFKNVEYKNDNSPLTLADTASNNIIINVLKENFENISILSEESKDDLSRLNNNLCFVVDPLDGTKEFIKRNGQFTVNIALSYKNRSIMGVIYVPFTNELYYATKGNGSFYVGNDGKKVKLKVTDITSKEDVRFVMSSSHGAKEMTEIIKKYKDNSFLKIGSSLKGCLIAKGDAEIYYRHNPTMEWDTAAMQCIVEQAGGIFKQLDDSDMFYNRENSLNDKGFYILNNIKNKL